MNTQIYEICENFNFNNLKLDNPTLLNANIYFSKLNSNLNKNFYVQLPKCKTKQGVVQANSKCFCDLEFNSADKIIVEFFENLEHYFIKEICNNKSLWFYDSDSISDDDINDFINPIMRSYKAGKKFLIKANIKQDKINIYDENEKKLTLADYDSSNEIIPLLNINGIRFSKSAFIVDIILVQFMILYPSDSLENQILIKISKNKEEPLENYTKQHTELNSDKLIEAKEAKEAKEISKNMETVKSINTSKSIDSNSFKYLMNNLETNKPIDDDCALEITDLDAIMENSDPIELKSPESIYLEIYRKAKQKAKEIRRNAVEAFLEAKNIKVKYNLASIISDSSSDEET